MASNRSAKRSWGVSDCMASSTIVVTKKSKPPRLAQYEKWKLSDIELEELMGSLSVAGTKNLSSKDSIPKDYFPIKRLPLELRLVIYRFALLSGDDVNRGKDVVIRLPHLPLPRDDPAKFQLISLWPAAFMSGGSAGLYHLPPYLPWVRPNVALLRTSRSVYKETMPLLYGENRFLFTQNKRAEDWKRSPGYAINKFLREIGPRGRANLRKLTIPMINFYDRSIPSNFVPFSLSRISLKIIAVNQALLGRWTGMTPLDDASVIKPLSAIHGCREVFFQPPDMKEDLTTLNLRPENFFTEEDEIIKELKVKMMCRPIRSVPAVPKNACTLHRREKNRKV